ncbi:MAG TPA: cytochrome P450 [Methylomirabilota bacterium]|nr:cytochrome P450 [Methylomirabilota bacterium]
MPSLPLFEPPTVIPPDPPYGPWRGALVLARNPVEWWPRRLYEGESVTFSRGSRRFLIVTDPADAETVLLDRADCFARSFLTRLTLGPALGEGLLTSDGDLWRSQRRLAAPAFSPRSIADLLPTMNRAAEDAASRLAHRSGRIDAMQEMVRTTFDIILETTLGPDAGRIDRDAAARDVGVYLETVGNPDVLDILGFMTWLPRPWKWAGYRAAGRMRDDIAAVVAARRARPADGRADLLAQLLAEADPDTGAAMAESSVVDNLLTFIAAGHETTALALTWTISILARLPDLQDALAKEAESVLGGGPVGPADIDRLDLHRRVLQESMRLYPPAPLIVRDVIADVEVGGHRLGPGDHVSIAVYPMQRSRTIWEEPNAFDPDRFLPDRASGRHRFAWLPFGGGPRICIGMGFAMAEAVTVLATLSRRVWFSAVDDHEIAPVQRVTLRPKGGMPVEVRRR